MRKRSLESPQLWTDFDLIRKRLRPRGRSDVDRAPDEAVLHRSAHLPLQISTGIDATKPEYLCFLRSVLPRAESLEVFVFRDRLEQRDHQQLILQQFFQNLLVGRGGQYRPLPESNLSGPFYVQDHAQSQDWHVVFGILAQPMPSLKSLVLGSGIRENWKGQHISRSDIDLLVAPDLTLNLLGECTGLQDLTLRGVALKPERYAALSRLNRLDYQTTLSPGGILEQEIIQIVKYLPELHTLSLAITFPTSTSQHEGSHAPDVTQMLHLTEGGHPSLRRVSVRVQDPRYAPEGNQRLFYAEFSTWIRAWRIPEVALSFNNRRLPSLIWEAFIKESLSPQPIVPVSPSAQDERSPTDLIAVDKLLILGHVGSTPIQRLFLERARSYWAVERAVTSRLRDLTIDSNVWTIHFDASTAFGEALRLPQLRDLTFIILPRVELRWQNAIPGLHDFSANSHPALGPPDGISITKARLTPRIRFPELRNVRIAYLDKRDSIEGLEHLTWSATTLAAFVESNFVGRGGVVEAPIGPNLDPQQLRPATPCNETLAPSREQPEMQLSSSDEPSLPLPVKLDRLTLHNLSLSHIGDPFPELAFAELWKLASEVDVEVSPPCVVIRSAKVSSGYESAVANVFELWDEAGSRQDGDPQRT